MKKLTPVFVFACLLVSLASPAPAQSGKVSPRELTRRLNMSAYMPPNITAVSADPESPMADDATTISAKIVPMSRKKDNYIKSAHVKYRAGDSSEWISVEMEEGDKNTWSADIPAQPSGSAVEYRIEAEDANGNAAAETGPQSDSPFSTDCGDAAPCAQYQSGWAPAYALQAAGAPHRGAKPGVDIMEIGAARATDTLILTLKCEDTVSPGSMSPIDANAYAFALLAPEGNSKSSSPKSVWFWAYAELAKNFGYPPAALISAMDKDIPASQSGFRYYLDGPRLVVEISAGRLGGNQPDEIALMAGSLWAFGADIQHVNVKLASLTPGLRIYFRTHDFQVQ